MPLNKYRQLTEGLWRVQSSILTQFLTGHIALTQYLHQITKIICCDAQHANTRTRWYITTYSTAQHRDMKGGT
jgi:hypothetical protein